jgi:hypothetical protein
MPSFDLGLVALGAAAGLLPDAVRFAKGRQQGFPKWFRKPGYWTGLGVLVFLGGLAAWLGQAQTWQTAIALGYAGPEFISRLGGDDGVTTRSVGSFELTRWWAK